MQGNIALSLLEKFQSDREQIERYAALVELCPLPAFVVSHDDMSIVYVNPAYEALTGRSAQEMKQLGWLQTIHPDDRENVVSTWKKFTETGEISTHRRRYVHKDGHVVDTVALLNRVRNNGYVGFIIPQCGDPSCPLIQIAKLASPAGLPPAACDLGDHRSCT